MANLGELYLFYRAQKRN